MKGGHYRGTVRCDRSLALPSRMTIEEVNLLAVGVAFLFGALDFFVSILELISEIAKIISFSFRLFGNIFAGEVMLLVLASLAATAARSLYAPSTSAIGGPTRRSCQLIAWPS